MPKIKSADGTTEIDVPDDVPAAPSEPIVVPVENLVDEPLVPDEPIPELAPEIEPAPVATPRTAGMITMLAPDAHATCSFGGESYVADEDGVIAVPASAVAALESHGFVAIED